MKKSEILKSRIKQYPNTEFKMFHYYLWILKFNVHEDSHLGYSIETKLNKKNPITYLYLLIKYIKVMFKGLKSRYRSELAKILCGTWFIDTNK